MEKRVERYNLYPGFLWGKQPLMQKIVIIQWNTVRSPYPPKNQEWYLTQLCSWRIITSQKQRHKLWLAEIVCGVTLFPSHQRRFSLSFKPCKLQPYQDHLEGLIKHCLLASPQYFWSRSSRVARENVHFWQSGQVMWCTGSGGGKHVLGPTLWKPPC